MLSLNRKHFVRLHGVQPDHAGIVVRTFDADFIGQANRINDAITTRPQPSSQLIRINRPGPS